MELPLRSMRTAALLLGVLGIGFLLGRASRLSSADISPSRRGLGADAALVSGQSAAGVRLPQVLPGESEYQRQEKLFSFAQSLSPANIPAALHEVLYLPVSQRNLALSVLLGRWAEVDPAGAVKYTMELPSSAEPYQLREKALATWAAKDFDSALAWTLKQERGGIRDECLTTLACSIAKTDPKQAMEFARTHAKGRGVTFAYQRIYGLWADRDYDGALAAAQLAEPDLRVALLYAVLERGAEKEPRAVLETMKVLKNPNLSNEIQRRAMETWTKRDLASAREWALSQSAGNLRAEAISRCVEVSVRKDAESTLSWASAALEGKERESAFRSIFWFTGGTDAEAALVRAKALTEPADRNTAIGAVADSLAATEPGRALELVEELPDGETRRQSISNVCETWAEREPQAAVQWLADHLSEADGPEALFNVISNWWRRDPTASLKWLQSLPPGSQKNELIAYNFIQIAQGNIEDAQAAFGSLDQEGQRAAAKQMAVYWAQQNPEAAVEWAAGLSDNDTRANAIKGAISMWGYHHTADAAKWLDGLPAGPDRDAGTQAFAETVVNKDPHGAIEWAASVADDLRRETALRQVVTSWIGRDKAAATDWLKNDTSLPEALRSELQRTAAVAQ